jgi:hypothetical protein
MPALGSFLAYTPSEWLLTILSLCNTLVGWYESLSRFTLKVFNATMTIFHPDTVIFFEKNAAPFNPLKLSYGATGAARVAWGYNLDKLLFVEWCGTYYNTFFGAQGHIHPLPVLSIEIIPSPTENDRVHYDLTDWAEKVRIETADAVRHTPTVAQILAAWSLSSGIVLDPSRFRVRLMNEQADTYEASVTDERPISFVMPCEVEFVDRAPAPEPSEMETVD